MKNKLIKTVSGLSLGIMVGAPLLASCAKPETSKEYHIMSISDIRGEIPGYGDPDFKSTEDKYAGAIRITDAMQEIAQKSEDYLVLSGGDQNGSGKFSSCTQGETMYAVMKAMGIRYSAVGNHEWDWGTEKLRDTEHGYDYMGRTDKTEGNYFITANVLEAQDYGDYKWELDESKEKFKTDFEKWNNYRAAWADPYKVVDLGGHKVCLIGLTTRETPYDGNQEYVSDFSFIDYVASIHYSKHLLKTTDLETFNQIESFILFTHCGVTENGGWIGGDVGDLANKIDTPIDAILAAHTRTPISGYVWNNKFDKKIAIAQVDDKMQTFADLKIEFDDSKPVGQRLKNITPTIVRPYIDKSSFAAAQEQLQKIIDNPRNEVVKNVCKVYDDQKKVALEQLKKELGKTSKGLTYLQSDYLKNYKYPEDIDKDHEKILMEQAGAFVCKSMIEGHNLLYDEHKFEREKRHKANIAYVSNVSINNGIDVKKLEDGKVTLGSIYDLFPYDEYTVTASLTYFQLEQIVRYMLTGKNAHTLSDLCTDEYLCEPDSQTPIVYSNLQFPFGPNQFYGFAFKVKKASASDKQFRKYDYIGQDSKTGVEASLVVYDPENPECDIDKPETWKGKEYWDAQTGDNKFITIVMNSFDFDYGNQQNKMINNFALYNANEHSAPIQIFRVRALDVRHLCIKYLEKLEKLGKEIELSDDICKQLIEVKG